ncbi:MAG: acyltransferase [Methylomonas sp.]|jgi:peptidoglycan/LPS O-acetylase OafA/YrhL
MSNIGRCNNFNFLRLLFATLVIFSHSPELIDGNRDREVLTQIFHTVSTGEVAVYGFFLLSGYLIVKSWHLNPNPLVFLRNRVLRIYPGFIVASILCVFIVGIVGSENAGDYVSNINYIQFIKDLIFLNPPKGDAFDGWPQKHLNGALWTIRYEFYCYLLVLVLGGMGLIKNRIYWLMAALLLISLFLYAKQAAGIEVFGYHFKFQDPIYKLAVFFFVGGCYYLFSDRLRINYKTCLLLFVIVVTGLFSKTLSEVVLAVAGGGVLFTFAYWNIYHIKRFQTLSDLSYGVYLYAWPIQKILIFYIPGISPWTVFIMTTPICLVLGWLSWNLVEKPFIGLKNASIFYKCYMSLRRQFFFKT